MKKLVRKKKRGSTFLSSYSGLRRSQLPSSEFSGEGGERDRLTKSKEDFFVGNYEDLISFSGTVAKAGKNSRKFVPQIDFSRFEDPKETFKDVPVEYLELAASRIAASPRQPIYPIKKLLKDRKNRNVNQTILAIDSAFSVRDLIMDLAIHDPQQKNIDKATAFAAAFANLGNVHESKEEIEKIADGISKSISTSTIEEMEARRSLDSELYGDGVCYDLALDFYASGHFFEKISDRDDIVDRPRGAGIFQEYELSERKADNISFIQGGAICSEFFAFFRLFSEDVEQNWNEAYRRTYQKIDALNANMIKSGYALDVLSNEGLAKYKKQIDLFSFNSPEEKTDLGKINRGITSEKKTFLARIHHTMLARAGSNIDFETIKRNRKNTVQEICDLVNGDLQDKLVEEIKKKISFLFELEFSDCVKIALAVQEFAACSSRIHTSTAVQSEIRGASHHYRMYVDDASNEALYRPKGISGTRKKYLYNKIIAKLDDFVQIFIPPPTDNNGFLRPHGYSSDKLHRLSQYVRWGRRTLVEPPRPVQDRGRSATGRISTEVGFKLKDPTRIKTDFKCFEQKIRTKGGSVLFDVSGSMSVDNADITKLLRAAPGCTIAMYSGSGTEGRLVVLAKNGRRTNPTALNIRWGGNVIDGPSLEWLSEQQEPRIWVSDGMATGVGDGGGNGHYEWCQLFIQKHGIQQVQHIRGNGEKEVKACLKKGKARVFANSRTIKKAQEATK